MLDEAGWDVGCDRVQRIWRREGLKVPKKQRPRGRLWLNDGSCIRLRPERRNHVWSYDFVEAQTHDDVPSAAVPAFFEIEIAKGWPPGIALRAVFQNY